MGNTKKPVGGTANQLRSRNTAMAPGNSVRCYSLARAMHFREDEDFDKIEWGMWESCKILNLEGLSFSWSPPVYGGFLRKAPGVLHFDAEMRFPWICYTV